MLKISLRGLPALEPEEGFKLTSEINRFITEAVSPLEVPLPPTLIISGPAPNTGKLHIDACKFGPISWLTPENQEELLLGIALVVQRQVERHVPGIWIECMWQSR